MNGIRNKFPWPVKTLDELIDQGHINLGRGKIISRKDLAATPGHYPVYSSAKENEGKFGEYGHYMFDEELITWSVDGGGRLFHRPRHKFSVTNVGGTLRINNTNILNYRFLFFCLTLQHTKINFDWVKKAHPSVIRKLYTDIPLPPLPEQKRIVAILDETFAGIATAVANAEKNLANARELFESHLNAVFTLKGDGWKSTNVGNICEVIAGQSPPGKYYNECGDGLPFYQGKKDFGEKYIQLAKKWTSYTTKEAYADDILMSVRAPVGPINFATETICIGRGLAAIRAGNDIECKFLFYCLLSKQNEISGNEGAVFASINKSQIAHIQITLPPLIEQKRIISSLDALSAETQRLESVYQQKLDSLAELKQSILQKAFSGELTKAPDRALAEASA